MSKKEKLDKEIDFLKEEFRSYFLLLIALLSGEATVIYAVLSGKRPIYVLYLVIIGFVFTLFIFLKIKDIKDETYSRIRDLEDE